MKYVVKVADKRSSPADKYYDVEIEDIRARPIVARVDGQEFEVSPEAEGKPALQKEAEPFKQVEPSQPLSGPGISTNELTAPLPGNVIEVFVKPGEHIETGQVILIIEAMKMKNSIRSTHAGKIVEVLVSAGQTVAHKQPMVRFG